jgi:hypothetical protein
VTGLAGRYRGRVRAVPWIAAVVWSAGAAGGCGGERLAAVPAPAPAPGAPLVLRDAAPASARPCPACRTPAGPAHACGASRWCDACGVDAAPTGHTCRVSRFCRGCGHEAALLGHRCGHTRFDPTLNADVERTDRGDDEAAH